MRGRALALLCLPALLSPALASPSPMAGVWFGTGQPGDRSEMYIDYLLPDGVFRNQHRYCRKGKALDIVEIGTWAFDGRIWTVHIQTINGQAQPRTDTYQVSSVDARAQHYVYLPTRFPYTSHRVANDFAMPGCDMTS